MFLPEVAGDPDILQRSRRNFRGALHPRFRTAHYKCPPRRLARTTTAAVPAPFPAVVQEWTACLGHASIAAAVVAAERGFAAWKALAEEALATARGTAGATGGGAGLEDGAGGAGEDPSPREAAARDLAECCEVAQVFVCSSLFSFLFLFLVLGDELRRVDGSASLFVPGPA